MTMASNKPTAAVLYLLNMNNEADQWFATEAHARAERKSIAGVFDDEEIAGEDLSIDRVTVDDCHDSRDWRALALAIGNRQWYALRRERVARPWKDEPR